uniref:Uncharacterized protein n=1 Tax=Tanacetum cinerariifolium TaxID=118510 RepID=A0A6L2LFT1_TANCI|nr:hypothetical protein [Tanacetum cinerariifolium]
MLKNVQRGALQAKSNKGKGIELLSDASPLEDAQLKKTLRKSKQETHKLQVSGSSKGDDFELEVPDEQTSKTKDTSEGNDESDDVHDKDDNDDDDGNDDDSGNDDNGGNDAQDSKRTDSDDDENPSFTLKDYKDEEQDKEYVHTPMKEKSNDEEKMYEEEDDDVVKELYRDLNINQGLKDADITNVEQGGADQQNASHKSGFVHKEEDAHVTLATVHDKTEGPLQSSSVSSDFTRKLLNLDDPSLDINSLMNTSTVPPRPPTVNHSPYLTTIPQQQTPDSITTTTTNPTTSLPEIPNFASLFQFDQRVSALESKVSEFNQTSQFAKAISLILGIVDNYLAFKLKEKVNVAVRLQLNKLREKAQTKNQEFLNCRLNHEGNNQGEDKDILSSYGDVVTLKRGRDDQDKNKDPSVRLGSSKGTETQHQSSSKSTQAKEPVFETADTKMQYDQGNKLGHLDDQPDDETAPRNEWFQKPNKPPTLNRAWNKSKSVDFRPPRKWISTIAKARQLPRMFNELMGTPIDFSAYVMNHLKIDNLTQEILVGHAFNLLKGTCKSFAKLEYHFEECYKAINDRLDWHNPEGR